MPQASDRIHVSPGEAWAIDPRAVMGGPEAFFFLFGPTIKETERIGDVAIIYLNGPLDHHIGGCGDSYEALLDRFDDAIDGGEAGPPSAIVLKVDSPGGKVAGLNATCARMTATARGLGIKMYSYPNEMAASAAYALSCACDEIIVPDSAIVGSIGVISTLVDVTKMDRQDGVRFEFITSGARKTDGHPHAPIDAGAIAAERKRVDILAQQFFSMVKAARGLSIGTISGYQAGIFLGKQAVDAGLADDCMSWEDCLAYIKTATKKSRVAKKSK
jgi:ClpP class serine protease